jgi:vanillate/3-O-methylgallate O-demethylase
MTDWDKTTVLDMMRKPVEGNFWETQMVMGPDEFEHGWFEEAQAFHKTCILGSWNGLWRIRIKGSDAEKFLMSICANSFKNYAVGQVKHALFCNKNGKLVINGLLIHEAKDEYIFTGGQLASWLLYQAEKAKGMNFKAELIDECSWAISGPTSVFACEKACGESLRDIKFMHCREVTINGVKARCIRQSMTAELGYEFQAPLKDSDTIKDALEAAGKEFGAVKYGGRGGLTQEAEAGFLQIMDSMLPAVCGESPEDKDFRKFMEKYAPGVFTVMMKRGGSLEFDDVSALYRSPIEIGEGAMVKFDHDFLGREALEKEASDPKRFCRSLIWNPEDVVDIFASLFRKDHEPYQAMEIPHFSVSICKSDKILDSEGRVIGHSTRNMYSPWYRCYFSNCVIDKEYAEIGTEVTVVYGEPGKPQKYVRAKVAPMRIKEDRRRDDVTKLPSYL